MFIYSTQVDKKTNAVTSTWHAMTVLCQNKISPNQRSIMVLVDKNHDQFSLYAYKKKLHKPDCLVIELV